MDNTPLISVLIPAYNAEATIRETLESIQSQCFSDFEAVVVDDGSTDCTPQIAGEFATSDTRFRLISKVNGGTASAYNEGLKSMRGEYAALCAADDVLLPECLYVHSRSIEERKGFDVFTSNGYFFHDNEGWKRVARKGANWGDAREVTLIDLAHSCIFGVGTVFSRQSALNVGGMRTSLADDYDLWVRMMIEGSRFWYTPEKLALFRISTTQRSAGFAEMDTAHRTVLEDALESPGIPASDATIIAEALKQFDSSQISPDERLAMERQRSQVYDSINRLPKPLRPLFGWLVGILSPLARPLRRLLVKRGPML
ncbi:MAG: glycosyltransferase [Coriobacteriia bacterium]|nr:glycosyltransferase [Coriobacteriia bacterium]